MAGSQWCSRPDPRQPRDIRRTIRIPDVNPLRMHQPPHHRIPRHILVGADGVRPETVDPITLGARRAPLPRPQLSPRSLGSFISGFKAFVTSRARRELNMLDVWRRNYYDHVIRGEAEFQKIWVYIDDNPRRWQEDQLHPSAPVNQFHRV